MFNVTKKNENFKQKRFCSQVLNFAVLKEIAVLQVHIFAFYLKFAKFT